MSVTQCMLAENGCYRSKKKVRYLLCEMLCEDDDRSSMSVQKVASVMFENEIVLPHMSVVVSLGARGFTSERHYTKLITY
jgi:hypothetical protein